MARRLGHLLSIVLLAAAATGCGATQPARFYTLSAAATADGTPATNLTVLVGPVSIPASVDRPEFVVQVAPNRVDIDEFNRWAAPLGDSVARAVAGDLSVLLGTPDVAVAPLANFRATYRVSLDVQRFDSIAGEAAVVEAVWTVHETASRGSRSGRTIAREPLGGTGFEAIAAAHGRAIARVSADIAAAIRLQASSPPESVEGGPARRRGRK